MHLKGWGMVPKGVGGKKKGWGGQEATVTAGVALHCTARAARGRTWHEALL